MKMKREKKEKGRKEARERRKNEIWKRKRGRITIIEEREGKKRAKETRKFIPGFSRHRVSAKREKRGKRRIVIIGE